MRAQVAQVENKKPGIAAGLSYSLVPAKLRPPLPRPPSSPPASSAGLGPRRGPLASAASISLIASVSVMLLHRRDLARQPVERGFVKLPLGIGLLRLGVGAEQVAHHLGDGDDVAGIDLGFVFLRPARPHGALDARAALQRLERALDQRRLGQLAHADRHDLGGRNPQRHLVLDEVDDEQLELGAGDLLLLDGQDLADAVGRIDDELVGLEALSLGSLLIAGHSGQNSFTGPFAGAGQFGCGSPVADGAARGMRGPPRFGRLFGLRLIPAEPFFDL